MGMFGKSFSREMGKNTGKFVSNKIFGDGHATPHKIIRENRAASSKLRLKKAKNELNYAEKESQIKLKRANLELKEEKKRLREQRREEKIQSAKEKLNEDGSKVAYYFRIMTSYLDRPWKWIVLGYVILLIFSYLSKVFT